MSGRQEALAEQQVRDLNEKIQKALEEAKNLQGAELEAKLKEIELLKAEKYSIMASNSY